MSRITKHQYSQNSSELHHAFYSQFVTDATLAFVKNQIGLERLRKCTDPHLNHVQGIQMTANGWIWDKSPIDLTLARELGAVSEGCLPSLATRTCVGKAAAKMLLAQ